MFPETVATLPDINICNYEGVVYTTALILLLWGWIRRKTTIPKGIPESGL